MSKINKDVLFLILKELQDDRNSLYSCLLVNKTWCEIIIPILWKNPLMYLKAEKMESQFNIIISHLSNETRKNLDNQGINLPTVQKKPLFDYISSCKYLHLEMLEQRIRNIRNIEYSKSYILVGEILKLFINQNTKITHLYIVGLNYPIHLIPGAKDCFSELKFLHCAISNSYDQNFLEELARIIDSIKILNFFVVNVVEPNNSGIIRLIEAQKCLNYVQFIHNYYYESMKDRSYKTLEESLIKHADTVQHLKMDWKPATKFFPYFVNLISLDINLYRSRTTTNWSHLENIYLPYLKILKAQTVPSKILVNLIENTEGYLTEIDISDGVVDNIRIIQAIYQNCPKLKYFKVLLINNDIILELEKLLIKCQHLNGLVVININNSWEDEVDYDSLFEILVNSSSTSLFMFKFKTYSLTAFKLESLKSFFDNWKDRKPMLLQTIVENYNVENNLDHFELFEKYKAKGIIKKYDYDVACWGVSNFEDFEWIQKILN